MHLKAMDADDLERYDQFLRDHDHSLWYYSLQYGALVLDLLGCEAHYLLALEGEALQGILPLMYLTKEGRRVYNSLPYFGSYGGVLATTPAAARLLAEAYNDLAGSPTTLAATLISHPLCPSSSEGIIHNFLDFRCCQFTRLSSADADPEHLMSRIEASARRNIKKAERYGVGVEVDHREIEALCRIHQANMEAVGALPKSQAFFEALSRHFSPGQDYDIYVARQDRRVIAALLIFYFKHTVEYFTPAIEESHRDCQPLSLLLLRAMTDAARRGFTLWNWGGSSSSMSGVYRFKKKWASQEVAYRYYTYVNDESLLSLSREEILAAFPHFFVVPFSALHPATDTPTLPPYMQVSSQHNLASAGDLLR